ncbi:SspB family protein [Hyphobacterium sp. SN044]|uniref:SspB family protein n=1 Tax=Hyphobacterium sp. SN044 TaxID=2912575 RepID=UPI0023519ED6|nr:ClpXP protease specificity-enhancing factor SspB [Hyphobacterium sp. SN044]
MRYDLLAQEALRGVIRQALLRAGGPGGLPGAHHFYITFKTTAPGVDLDPSLLERYPEEMTIVLEHQFWDLNPAEDFFEVTLKFNKVPKYMKVPYSAVHRFHDPSVGFHLQFEPIEGEEEAAGEAADAAPAAEPVELKPAKPKSNGNGESAEVVSLDSFRKK